MRVGWSQSQYSAVRISGMVDLIELDKKIVFLKGFLKFSKIPEDRIKIARVLGKAIYLEKKVLAESQDKSVDQTLI